MLIRHSLTMYYSITGVPRRRGADGELARPCGLFAAYGHLAQQVSWGCDPAVACPPECILQGRVQDSTESWGLEGLPEVVAFNLRPEG